MGVDLFDVTINKDDPDALFFSWLGQIQWAKALDDERDILLITRLASQLSPDSVLPFEKFSLGGINTVRGYRRNFFVGDNGVVGSIELAFSLLDNPLSQTKLKLIPFFALGRVWDTDGNVGESLASLGLGIEFQPTDWIGLRLDLALPLTEVEDRGDSASDRGISFSLEFTPF